MKVATSANLTLTEAAAYKRIHADKLMKHLIASTGPTNSGTLQAPSFTKANLDAWSVP